MVWGSSWAIGPFLRSRRLGIDCSACVASCLCTVLRRAGCRRGAPPSYTPAETILRWGERIVCAQEALCVLTMTLRGMHP
eukprot:2726661-Rhodomonas_salina.1